MLLLLEQSGAFESMAPPGIGGLMVRSGAALLSSARSLELEVLRQSVWFFRRKRRQSRLGHSITRFVSTLVMTMYKGRRRNQRCEYKEVITGTLNIWCRTYRKMVVFFVSVV